MSNRTISLPPETATDDEVASWVRGMIVALDDDPRDPRWRYRALGMTRAEAIRRAPTKYRLDLQVPIGEMRVIRSLAEERGLGVRPYVRRLLATALIAAEGVDPDELPSIAGGGMIRPWPGR